MSRIAIALMIALLAPIALGAVPVIQMEVSDSFVVTVDGLAVLDGDETGRTILQFDSWEEAAALASVKYSEDPRRTVRVVQGTTWTLADEGTSSGGPNSGGTNTGGSNTGSGANSGGSNSGSGGGLTDPNSGGSNTGSNTGSNSGSGSGGDAGSGDSGTGFTPPPPVTGLSDLSDLSGYHVIDVYPTSALKKSGFSGLVWKHPSDTWNPTDETKSASAYIRKYSWKHMDGVAGYEKPIAARFHPGRHEGAAQLQMSSVDPDRPALAFSADLNDPAIMWDNGVEVRGPNVLVQGFVVPNGGHGAGSFELDAYKGQFDPAVWKGRRVVQRFEGCTFNGGVGVQRQGDPQWSGVEIIGCRFNGGRHGAFVKNIEPYQGMPGLILERCLFYRPGSSSTRDHGMYLSHANGVLVRSCIIAEASGSAIKAHASHDVTVIDNLIFGCHSAASPNANTGSSYGKSTERFVFKNNIVTEMNLGQPAFWMGWSLDGADISNNLFCNTYNPAGNGALFYLAGPFEGTGADTPTTTDDAQPMRNVRIENNLAFNYTGAFLSVYTDFHKNYPWTMTIRGNKQGQSLDAAMVASWSPGSWSKAQWTQAREGITVTSDNIWADQYDDADRPQLPGHTNGGVSVKDPTFDLAQLNKALGGNASRQAFIDDLPNRDPGLVIDKALKLYREAYTVTGP